MGMLGSRVGIPLSADKDVRMAAENAFLGVLTNLSRVMYGIAIMSPKP